MADRSSSAVASSGELRPSSHDGVEFAHHWTPQGVVVETEFTGGHLLHLAVAGCVLNDVHREAGRLGMPFHGVRVTAGGDVDRETWRSTGITYRVEVSSPASARTVDGLLRSVDQVAEMPEALRTEATVERV